MDNIEVPDHFRRKKHLPGLIYDILDGFCSWADMHSIPPTFFCRRWSFPEFDESTFSAAEGKWGWSSTWRPGIPDSVRISYRRILTFHFSHSFVARSIRWESPSRYGIIFPGIFYQFVLVLDCLVFAKEGTEDILTLGEEKSNKQK